MTKFDEIEFWHNISILKIFTKCNADEIQYFLYLTLSNTRWRCCAKIQFHQT